MGLSKTKKVKKWDFGPKMAHKNPKTRKIKNLVDAIVEDHEMKISANF